MKAPAYVLDIDRFNLLMKKHGYRNLADFAHRTGIPIRTLRAVVAQRYDLTGTTIRYFLDGFPGVSFEYLFPANRTPSRLSA